MMVLFKDEYSLSGGVTQPLLAVSKTFELFALSASGDIKTFGMTPCTHTQ